jgi:hypothetical protein
MLFTVSGDDKRTTSGKREPGEHSNATLRREQLKQHAPLFHFTVVRNEINFHGQLVLKQTRSKTLKTAKNN